MSRLATVSAVVVLALSWSALAPAREAPADEGNIRELIGQLDHAEYKMRTEAQTALREIGIRAVPALREAEQTTRSLEVRARARATITAILRAHWVRVTGTAREATALVPGLDRGRRGGDPGSRRFQAAVCVHPSGLFVTAADTPNPSAFGERTYLILRPGHKKQKEVQVRVIRADRRFGLALLQAEGEGTYPAVALGDEEELAELAEVAALAFSDPAGWAPGKFPAPEVPRGLIASLRRQAGELESIRVETEATSNDLLGPVVEVHGKLIGLTVGGSTRSDPFGGEEDPSPGPRAYTVLPVGRIRSFLETPVIQFEAPVLRQEELHKPAVFTAKVIPTLPGSAPEELALLLPGQEKERRFKMTAEGNTYRAEAVPVEKPATPPLLGIVVTYEEGSLEAGIADQVIEGGGNKVHLSAVRSLTHEPGRVRVHLADGKEVVLPASALNALKVRIAGEDRPIPFGGALKTTLQPPAPVTSVPCRVAAYRGLKEVAGVVSSAVVLDSSRRYALYFDGRGGLTVPAGPGLDGSKPFTFEAVVTPYQPTLEVVIGSTGGAGVALGLSAETGHWHFSAYLGGPAVQVSSPAPATLKERTHLAGVYDTRTLTLYVNGKRQGQVPLPPGAPLGKGPGPLRLGSAPSGRGFGEAGFEGLVEGIRFARGERYKAAFTPTFALGRDADTLLLLQMNEGTGSLCHDASGAGHHAESRGTRWVEVPPGGFTADALPSFPPTRFSPSPFERGDRGGFRRPPR